MDTRTILAQNLDALMKRRDEGQSALKRRSGVAQATVGRILKKQTAADIDTISALAKAYNLMAWQLLVPNLDPTNPPVVKMTEEERKLYERLQALAAQIVHP